MELAGTGRGKLRPVCRDGQTRQIPELIAGLKAREDKDIYLVAEINVCRDALYASRSTTVCLRTELGGNYTDDEGAWLDPYNTELRQYVVDMCNELYDMGFDEVVLANVLHPTITDENTKLVYTRDMSSPPSAVNAVCGFAVSVADACRTGRGGSRYTATAARRLSAQTLKRAGRGAVYEALRPRVPPDGQGYLCL